MAVFLPDERADQVTVAYAAGAQAAVLRSISRATGTGVAGWVAVNRRPALNADPSLDLGPQAPSFALGLRACLAVPLIEGTTLIAVLAVYREAAASFSEDDARLLELLAPRLASSLVEAVQIEESASQPAAAIVPLKLVRRATS
jgi:GAF domain-containing protein